MSGSKKRFPYEHVIAVLLGIALFYFGWQLKDLVAERSASVEKAVRLRNLYVHLKTYCNEYGSYPSTAGKDRYSSGSAASDLNLLSELGFAQEEEIDAGLWSYNANALPDSEDPLVSEKGVKEGRAERPIFLLRANGEILKAKPERGILPKECCDWGKLGD
ncbi:hypothetical protein IKZ40_08375 [bacterium]|nr:hypothetical protein [bacterium]